MISHEQAIANLIYRHAFLVDDSDFAGLGTLFADGQLVLNDAPAAGWRGMLRARVAAASWRRHAGRPPCNQQL